MTRPIPAWCFHVLAAILILSATVVYYRHAMTASPTPGHGDQAAYLELACNLKDGDGFVSHGLSAIRPYLTITRLEGIRGPLYPLLLSPWAERRLEFFIQAKVITVILSLAGAILLYIVLSKCYNAAAACLVLALLLNNRHFVVFATELWCENLLLFLAFFAGLLWWRKTWPIPSGILAALALLTKKVTLPLVVIVIVVELIAAIFTRKSEDRLKRIGWLLRFTISFLAVLLPYMTINWIQEKSLFNNTDLSAHIWMDEGLRDAWILYESPPSMGKYFSSHSLGQIILKFLSGLGPQALNFISLGDTIFWRWILPLGWLLWPLVIYGLFRSWKRKRSQCLALILQTAFLFTFFTWYAHIDVDPRFVIVLLPLLFLVGAAGLHEIHRLIRWKFERIPVLWSQGIPAVLVLLFTISLASNVRFSAVTPASMPPPQQSAYLLLRENLPQNAILCTGPSHWFPYLWLFKNKTLFVPSLDSLDNLNQVMAHYGSDYLFLDRDTIMRRKDIFEPWFKDGIELPGFEVIGPPRDQISDFIFYKRVL